MGLPHRKAARSPTLIVSPVTVFHISAGILGLLSGGVAVSLRKGSRRHSVAGRVFVVSMLSMSASGAYAAFHRSQTMNLLMGLFTFYLVATGWATARRKEGRPGFLDGVALLFVSVLGASLLTFGVQAVNSESGLKDGYPAVLYFIFGSIAVLSAAGDIRMLVRGGVAGKHRLARHLWRMCFALYIAAASFFLGQQKVFPVYWRGSKILLIPPIVTLLLMIYWLIRTLVTRRAKARPKGETLTRTATRGLPEIRRNGV